jgi:hypothetical protein
MKRNTKAGVSIAVLNIALIAYFLWPMIYAQIMGRWTGKGAAFYWP